MLSFIDSAINNPDNLHAKRVKNAIVSASNHKTFSFSENPYRILSKGNASGYNFTSVELYLWKEKTEYLCAGQSLNAISWQYNAYKNPPALKQSL